jgi:ABC-type sugar transport system ATPase subunit
MNFLSVAISGNPEAPLLSLAGHKFLPPKKWNFAERRRSPASYLFGIRPEHVHVRENEPGSDLTARIASVEEHGREKLVRLVLGSEKLTALAVSDTIEAGREVGLELEFENAHLFEKPAPPEPGT